jgi:hypothetical protein
MPLVVGAVNKLRRNAWAQIDKNSQRVMTQAIGNLKVQVVTELGGLIRERTRRNDLCDEPYLLEKLKQVRRLN